MPQLDEIIAKRKKKFVKKAYRPWDLSGKGTATNNAESKTAASNVEKNERLKTAEDIPAQKPTQQKSVSITSSKTNLQKSGTKKQSQISPKRFNLEQKLERNKSSMKEFNRVQKSSEKEFTRVHSSSNKSSQGFNKGSPRVQLNPNSESTLIFEDSTFITKKLIRKLNGNEKKLFFFVVEICSLKGALTTGEIFSEDMDELLKMPRNSRETAIKRLQGKGLLIREVGRRGSNGIIMLTLPEIVKTEALHYLSIHQTERELILNLLGNRVQLGFNNTHSSSSNIYNNITTNLPDDWKQIDIIPLKAIRFSETQLKQLIDKSTPDIVQDSIYQFAYGLQHNPKVQQYKDPLNVLMGVLRKGNTWSEPDYESPKDRAMRELLERKKAEADKRKGMEKELQDLSFQNWYNALKETEKKAILSEITKNGKIVGPQIAHFRDYFNKTIWSDVRFKELTEIKTL